MARKKKDGKRAKGIQGKKGKLYVVTNQIFYENGTKKVKKNWIRTGLDDVPGNIKKALDYRERVSKSNTITLIDRNITMSDFVDEYLKKKERDVSDTTYRSYYHRGLHIKSYFGEQRVKDIDEATIECFLDNLFTSHGLQPRTVKDIRVYINGIMEYAYKENLISYNPVVNVSISKKLAAEYLNDKADDEKFFSYEEAGRFLEIVKDHPFYELFYMALFFGLRREEVLGLRWSSINLKKKTMLVNHTVTKGTKINRLNVTKTKASKRTYPLTDDQVKMLGYLKYNEQKNRRLFGDSYYDSDYVFKHADGSLYYPDTITKAFGKVIAANPDLPQGITFHGLRTSCVSILVHDGKDVKSIQEWVGHESIETTLKWYTKAKEKESKAEISENMSSIIQLKEYK